jgi:hypothetical protein
LTRPRRKATGSPEEFARRLDLGKTVLMENINDLRELGAEVCYDKIVKSYYYTNSFILKIGTLSKSEISIVKGGVSRTYLNLGSVKDCDIVKRMFIKQILTISIIVFSFNSLLAQTGKIVGRIIDSKTFKPLPLVNIFINKTTYGTITDNLGNFELRNIPFGSAEIVVQSGGYLPQQVKLEVKELNKPIAVLLESDAQQFTEVETIPPHSKGWEEELKRFKHIFLGRASKCKILNEGILHFSTEKNVTIANALLPLEIENRHLGYNLTVLLQQLRYSSSGYQLVGSIRFKEMNTSDPQESAAWIQNREIAYLDTVKQLRSQLSIMLPTDYKPKGMNLAYLPEFKNQNNLQEKVYLHLDKPYYYPGQKIWLSAYMNYKTPALRDSMSNVLYVDLINEERIIKQTLILKIEMGRAYGSIRISNQAAPGTYIVRAYTKWMRNFGLNSFFYKPVNILSPTDNVGEYSYEPISNSSLRISFDKREYAPRSEVKMIVSLNTSKTISTASLSVSILDEQQVVAVKEPSFIKENFKFYDTINRSANQFIHPIEKGITIAGTYEKRKGVRKKTMLTIIPEDFHNFFQVSTLENGAFSLRNLSFYDSLTFGFQPKEGRVILKHEKVGLPDKLPEFKLKLVDALSPHKLSMVDVDTLNTTMLQDVQVVGKRIIQYQNAYAKPDYYLGGENIGMFASAGDAIAAKIPGYSFVSQGGVMRLTRMRGADGNGKIPEPVLFVDNVLVAGAEGGWGTTGEVLLSLNPSMIDHIEVKGMIGSNMGANGSNGFISVFMKKNTETPFKGLLLVKVRGFDKVQSFQHPSYDGSSKNSTEKDFRSTLYWNPIVNLSSNSPSEELSFYTSDQEGSYRVIIEGITSMGNLIHCEALMNIKDR